MILIEYAIENEQTNNAASGQETLKAEKGLDSWGLCV